MYTHTHTHTYIYMAFLIAQLVKNLLQWRKPRFDSWVRKIPWRRDKLPTPVFLGFPYGSASKESACNVGDLGLIPGLGRSPGKGNGYPLQYSDLENYMQSVRSYIYVYLTCMYIYIHTYILLKNSFPLWFILEFFKTFVVFFPKYLFIWLHWILVASCGIFHFGTLVQ